jgi:hypothetical protein
MEEAEDIVMTQKTDLSRVAVDTIITAGEDATVIAKDKEKTIKAKHLQCMFIEYRYLQYLLPHK